jgi:O-antigen ligase
VVEEQSQNTGASIIVAMMARVMPMILLIYWPIYAINSDVAAFALRPVMLLLTVIMGICLIKQPLAESEFRMFKVFGIMWLAMLATSIAGAEPETSLIEWVKLVIIQTFCLFMARALRHQPTAKVLGKWMLIASIGTTIYIIGVYFHMMGAVIPTYRELRVLKGEATKLDIPLNTIGAGAILEYICAICLIPRSRLLYISGCIICLVSSFMTGSRAALVVPVSAVILVQLVTWIRSEGMLKRFTAWGTLIGGTLTLIVLLSVLNPIKLTNMTEGRWDMWRAGTSKFLERPLMGYGFRSWRDDLVARLPGDYQETLLLAKHIAGAYHNQFVTCLAEHGVLGTSALITLYVFLMMCAFRLGYQKCYVSNSGKAAMFGAAFLFVRANVELPGLFGAAQEPADYLSYIFFAILISQIALEEQYVNLAIQMRERYKLAWTRAATRRRASIAGTGEPALGEG